MNDNRPLSQDDEIQEGTSESPPNSSTWMSPMSIIIAMLTVAVLVAFFALTAGFVYEVAEAAWDWGQDIGNWVTGQ